MSENEELFGKVKQAQTLSRKDSLKSRHLESELSHMKDEFERIKLEYDETKAAIAAIDVRGVNCFLLLTHFLQQKLKADTREESGVSTLSEDILSLKAGLARLQSSLASRETGQKWLSGETVSHRLESHQELINEVKQELHYQVTFVLTLPMDRYLV